MERFRETQIDKLGLADRVNQLYKEGNSIPDITNILNGEGFDLKKSTVGYFMKVRIKDPKKAAFLAEETVKDKLRKEVAPELKLLESTTEAYRNYEACTAKKDSSGATKWFEHYKDLLEKQLRSSGVYERAKNEASREKDKYIEIVWKNQVVCEKCGAILSEEIEKHEKINLADMQSEDIKESIADEMSRPSVSTDGKAIEE
jgi:hypothetical protein